MGSDMLLQFSKKCSKKKASNIYMKVGGKQTKKKKNKPESFYNLLAIN
jgi:hypothetical protein